MKKNIYLFAAVMSILQLFSCESVPPATNELENATGQSSVVDNLSEKNVVQIAMGSKDHSTLITAIKSANLVDALSNAGPFTVFAPTNKAFAALPAGTLDNLLLPANKDALRDILQYHVSLGVFKTDAMTDGQIIGQVNGENINVSKKDGILKINGKASIIATIPASNGIIYVIDGVLLPPSGK